MHLSYADKYLLFTYLLSYIGKCHMALLRQFRISI